MSIWLSFFRFLLKNLFLSKGEFFGIKFRLFPGGAKDSCRTAVQASELVMQCWGSPTTPGVSFNQGGCGHRLEARGECSSEAAGARS